MSRPASLKSTASPFVKRREKPGAQKLGIDWDRVEPSYNHKLNHAINHDYLTQLRLDLAYAIDNGLKSKEKKVRREINRMLEDELSIEHTWCGGCLRDFYNCRCRGLRPPSDPNHRRRLARKIAKAEAAKARFYELLGK